MRRSDTLAERRAFLDDLHRTVFGRGLEAVEPDTLATVLQTCADSALLSDVDVRTHWENVDQIVEAEAGAHGPGMEEAAIVLRAVLRREMVLRSMSVPGEPDVIARPPVHVLDGAWRTAALWAIK